MNDREKLILEAAILYYQDGLTQNQIAKRIHISRPSVSNLLKEAREKGIVKISIHHPDTNFVKQQDLLKNKYKLREAIIIKKENDDKLTRRKVGEACATFVENNISNYQSIGVGWGTTMYEFVQAASYIDTGSLEITPLIGGVGITNTHLHSNHLVFNLAEKYNAKASFFYAPALVESLELKRLFDKTELYQSTYSKACSVDLAITSVGNPVKSSTYKKLKYFSPEEENDLAESNVIGDILATFFNKYGEEVHNNVSERMMGIKLSDLKKVNEILVMATGEEKKQGTLTLLKENFIDYLIIDDEIATFLLKK